MDSVPIAGNALDKNQCYDSVGAENDKPEGGTSGESESVNRRELQLPPTIADLEYRASGNHFLNEAAMSSSARGFTKVARSLREHPAYAAASRDHRLFIRELLDLVVWKQVTFYIGIHSITLEPGQYCASERGLASELSYGNDPKSKTKIFKRHAVEGAGQFWERVGFIRQEVRHGKTIITIIYSAFCELQEKESPPEIPPNFRQTSATKEDILDVKIKKKKPRRAASIATADGMRLCEFFVSSLKVRMSGPKIPTDLNKWASEFDILLRDHAEEKIIAVLTFLPNCWYQVHVRVPAKFREEWPRIEGLYRQALDGTNVSAKPSRRHKHADGTPIKHELEGVF